LGAPGLKDSTYYEKKRLRYSDNAERVLSNYNKIIYTVWVWGGWGPTIIVAWGLTSLNLALLGAQSPETQLCEIINAEIEATHIGLQSLYPEMRWCKIVVVKKNWGMIPRICV